MYWLGISTQWVSVALQIWILALSAQRALHRSFPLFTTYMSYLVLQTVLRSVFLSKPDVYFYIFWITAPLEVILTLLAAHESFMKVFGNFYLLWWFRFLFPSAIIAALAYSGCNAYMHPPVNTSPTGMAIISAQIASQYIILGISVLFFSL